MYIILNHRSALATTTNKEEHKMSSREHTKDVIDTDCMRNLAKNLSAPNSIYHVLCQSWIWGTKCKIILNWEIRNKAKMISLS